MSSERPQQGPFSSRRIASAADPMSSFPDFAPYDWRRLAERFGARQPLAQVVVGDAGGDVAGAFMAG